MPNPIQIRQLMGLFQSTLPMQGETFNPLTDVADPENWVLFTESDSGTFQDVEKTTPAVENNAAVKAWADQSGTPHDATEATNNPILKTNVVGTMPGIYFDGSKFLATASFASGIGFGGYTLFVSLVANGVDIESIFARDVYSPVFYSNVGGGVVGYYSGGASSYSADLDVAPHVLTFRRLDDGSNKTALYVDGVLDAVITNTEVANWTAAVLTIFGNGGGSQGGNGYCFAVGLYKGTMSDTDRAAVETYLLGKISGFFLSSGSFTYSSSIE